MKLEIRYHQVMPGKKLHNYFSVLSIKNGETVFDQYVCDFFNSFWLYSFPDFLENCLIDGIHTYHLGPHDGFFRGPWVDEESDYVILDSEIMLTTFDGVGACSAIISLTDFYKIVLEYTYLLLDIAKKLDLVGYKVLSEDWEGHILVLLPLVKIALKEEMFKTTHPK
jgi:hypothetical protein